VEQGGDEPDIVYRGLAASEFNGAVSEEEKIMAISKIVLNLKKQNDL
jgi:hypothetical protein